MSATSKPMGDKLCAWLEQRGLDLELAAKLGLWSAVREGEAFRPDASGDWCAIPYLLDGAVVSHKYRLTTEKRFATDKGFGGLVWNADALADPGPLLITEGEMDAMAAIQAGHARVVSVPTGAPKREDGMMRWLDAVAAALSLDDRVIVAADGDEAGAGMLRVIVSRLGPGRCSSLRYPKGCKDLGDALREYGVRGVKATLERAQPIPVKGLFANPDVPTGSKLEIWRPRICKKLDDMVAICPGQWSVWTGIPGEGKTTLTQAILFDVMDRYGLRSAWFSGEKDPSALQVEAAAWLAGQWKGFITEGERENGRRWLDEHVWHIVDVTADEPDEVQSLDWFLELAETAAIRHGARLFVLDPWNDIEHDQSSRETETQYIGRALKAITRFCRRHDAHVAIIAHPYKLKRGEAADGYSINGSAHWYNKTFLGATVSRVDPQNPSIARKDWPTKLTVWKVKDHEQMGYPGAIELRMTAGGRFEALVTDEDYYDRRQSNRAAELAGAPA